MTSLFSHEDVDVGAPVDLISGGLGGVELLEFTAVGSGCAEDAAAAAEDTPADEEAHRAERTRVMLDAAREEAIAETRRTLGAEYEERVQKERRRIGDFLEEFEGQRTVYFSEAERVVVRLAMTVAAKILQHEVQVDTLHLAGTVRAALSRVSDGSSAVLRVRPEEVGVWEQVFAEEHGGRVEVLGDKTMRLGDLVLETTLGRVELGVLSQLGEIERGFRELMERAG